MGQFGQKKGEPAPNSGQRYPAEVLSQEEVAALIAACSTRAKTGIRNRALLMLLYRSGLRVGEVLKFRPADLSMTAHSIRLLDTKSGKPQTRGYHPSVDDALARWMDTRKTLNTRGAPMFCTLDGGKIDPQQIRNLVKRLAQKAGIEKRVHPHALRHTFAAEMEAAGTPVTVISKLLGHSSIAVTARYLDHLTNAQAISVLENTDLPELKVS
jgi:site-specific recombinase XerD